MIKLLDIYSDIHETDGYTINDEGNDEGEAFETHVMPVKKETVVAQFMCETNNEDFFFSGRTKGERTAGDENAIRHQILKDLEEFIKEERERLSKEELKNGK